jgi:D-alanine-D-alanine ligase
MDKKNILVIFGGRSVEHDISIITAQQVMNAIDLKNFNILPVYISIDGFWYSHEDFREKNAFKEKNKIATLPKVWITPSRNDSFLYSEKKFIGGSYKKHSVPFDVAFPLVHGSNGEDGTLQGLLELKDVPYVGSDTIASAICMNKFISKHLLQKNGIDVLPCIHFNRKIWFKNETEVIDAIENQFGYPVIIKPNSLGSSIGVSAVKSREELFVAIENAIKLDLSVIAEPMIVDIMEINCAVLDGEKKIISMTEQPISSGKLLDFETKYMHGNKGKKLSNDKMEKASSRGMEDTPRIMPAPVDQEIIKLVEEISFKTFELLNLSGVSRIDFIFDLKEQKLFVNEVNTIPGSLSFYLFQDLDIDFTSLNTKLIENAIRVHSIKSQKNYEFKTGIF